MKSRWFIFSIFLILVFTLLAFVYFATSTLDYPKPPRPAVIADLLNNPDPSSLPLHPDHITFMLNEIGAYQLHNPPASSETPKIEIIVDGKIYSAETIAGVTTTRETTSSNPDIAITTTKDEVFAAIRSADPKAYIKSSIQQGKTTIEQRNSYSMLFAKGYLNIYNDLSGKSMTGNIISIFSED